MRNGQSLNIENIIKGDPAAFEAMYNAYWNMVYYTCLKYLNSQPEAEEAAQDVFFALYKDIGRLSSPNAFHSYFSRILVNTCYNRVMSYSYRNSSNNISIDSFVKGLQEERSAFLPEGTIMQKELESEIVQLIDELPDKQREAMLLHYLHELSQSEIAEILDVKPNVVGNRLFLAKTALKKKLASHKGGKWAAVASAISVSSSWFFLATAFAGEAAQVATPEIGSRIWLGLQDRIAAVYCSEPGSEPSSELAEASSASSTSGAKASYTSKMSSTAINAGIITMACAAVVCLATLGVNYASYQRAETTSPLSAVSYGYGNLAESGDEIYVPYEFAVIQIITRNTPEAEIEYRLYQRDCQDMRMFRGVKEINGDVFTIYKVVPLGTPPPADVAAWINQHVD